MGGCGETSALQVLSIAGRVAVKRKGSEEGGEVEHRGKGGGQ